MMAFITVCLLLAFFIVLLISTPWRTNNDSLQQGCKNMCWPSFGIGFVDGALTMESVTLKITFSTLQQRLLRGPLYVALQVCIWPKVRIPNTNQTKQWQGGTAELNQGLAKSVAAAFVHSLAAVFNCAQKNTPKGLERMAAIPEIWLSRAGGLL